MFSPPILHSYNWFVVLLGNFNLFVNPFTVSRIYTCKNYNTTTSFYFIINLLTQFPICSMCMNRIVFGNRVIVKKDTFFSQKLFYFIVCF